MDTVFQGVIPTVTDGDGHYVLFDTQLEAQKEVVDHHMTKLRQFLDGERDYEDAITVDEYVVRVEIRPDGTFLDEHGRVFSSKAE